MRLLRVELSRFFSRRAVAMLLLAAALLTALVAGTTIWGTRPVDAAEQARAEARVQAITSSPEYKRDLANCQESPEDLFGPGADAADCRRLLAPSTADVVGRVPLALADEVDDSGIAVIVIVTVLMIVAGTTFAGADWASGSMSNQMLFEPRRQRVWWAKAGAALVGTGVAAAVLIAAFWVALYLVADARGIGTGAAVQTDIRWMVARGVSLAALAGFGGYALTMLLRHTVGTLAVLFVYAAGGEALISLLPVERSGQYSPAENVFAWIRDGGRVFDSSIDCPVSSAGCDQTFQLTLLHGGAYLAVLVLLVTVVSAVLFQRRDIP
ncbi:MAG: hypothetical protein HOQ22_03045 [Nocardioidaceae bacterium]|nr:hypothetical protein [Nocardioidaceae bacterium]NUS50002.1 hypothetical protein [Nocardioidaceae bacterium]